MCGILKYLLLLKMTTPEKLKLKIELPVKFSGDGVLQPDVWLERFCMTATIAEWTETDMVKYLPMFLTGIAASWAKTITLDVEWKSVKKSFLETFLTTTQVQFPELALHERVYREGLEQINQYYFDKIHLCQLFDPLMTSEKKVQHLIKGLPVRWQTSLFASQQLSPEDLLVIINKMRDSEVRSVPVASASVPITVDVIRDIIKTELAKIPSVAAMSVVEKQQDLVECQICHKKGHTADNCFHRYGHYSGYRGNNRGRGSYQYNRGRYNRNPKYNGTDQKKSNQGNE